MEGSTLLFFVCAAAVLLIYLYYQRQFSKLRAQSTQSAQDQFENWRNKELERLRLEQLAIARRESKTDLQGWKIAHEASIRADAIMRSQAVIAGKVTENIIPFMPIFPYNPKDVRFIGSPVDLIVFDGAAEGHVNEVIFLEVKTGNSSLARVQKQIRDAVISGKVQWRELRVKSS